MKLLSLIVVVENQYPACALGSHHQTNADSNANRGGHFTSSLVVNRLRHGGGCWCIVPVRPVGCSNEWRSKINCLLDYCTRAVVACLFFFQVWFWLILWLQSKFEKWRDFQTVVTQSVMNMSVTKIQRCIWKNWQRNDAISGLFYSSLASLEPPSLSSYFTSSQHARQAS